LENNIFNIISPREGNAYCLCLGKYNILQVKVTQISRECKLKIAAKNTKMYLLHNSDIVMGVPQRG